MIRFKQYLEERLELDDKHKKVLFLKQTLKYASDLSGISTLHSKMKTGYISQDANTFGHHKVISLFNYRSSEDSKNILKGLKGQGEYSIDHKAYHSFLDYSASYAVDIIKKQQVETIVYPKSSSPFLKDFIEKIEIQLPTIEFLHDSLVKKQFHDIEDYAKHMIDTEYYGYNKFSEADINHLVKSIINNVKQNEQDGKGPILTLKGTTIKRNNHLLKNFMDANIEDDYHLIDKDVLIIDDSWSTGVSIKEMIRVIEQFLPKSIKVLTIFKLTTSNT